MQRTTTVTVGLLFVAALGALAVTSLRPAREPEPVSNVAPRPSASAQSSATPSASASSALPVAEQLDGDAAASPLVTEGFETFPDGGKVPELPASAPNRVNLGVVVFTYQGAQGAPRDARPKEQAKQRATEALELAQKDFAAAVAKGDHGSTTDAGRIPRGILEPPIEFWLFGLEKGKVYPEPVDTPRGYWVMRRNE